MNIVQIIVTAILILGLIYIYTRSDRSEDFLLLKLFGYYILGSFRFNFNKIAIPLGFLIYLLFLHPKMNIRNKRWAALLGLVIFIVGLAQPAVENYLYQLPIKVKAESVNLYDFDYLNDWESMCQKLELPDQAKIEDFQADFEADGEIRELRYQLISRKDGDLVHYNVNFQKQRMEYIIRRIKIDQWLQYDRLVTAQRFFEVVSELDINKLKPEEEYVWYCIASRGELGSYGVKDGDNFILGSKGDIVAVDSGQLPLEGYYISLYGMYRLNEVTCEGRGYKNYLFDIIQN